MMLKATIVTAVLLGASSAFAGPVTLTAPQMDRVSAGAYIVQSNLTRQVRIARAIGPGSVAIATNRNVTSRASNR